MIAATMLAIASAQPTAAQSIRTFVSATGNNASALCTATAPCLTFAGALAKTTAGGEITVLDPGDYGPVTINKSVSIVADGVEAGIQVSSGTAIVVNAGANDIVILRGLVLDGLGPGVRGIRFDAGGALHIQRSVIRGFRGPSTTVGYGVLQSAAASELYMSDTLVASNRVGINVTGNASAAPKAVLDRVQVEGNVSEGVEVYRGANVMVRDSLAAGNGASGFRLDFDEGLSTRLTIERSAVVNNGNRGLLAIGSTARAVITKSTFTGNDVGVSSGPGVVVSFGNNRIAGNGSDGGPDSTIAPR